MAQLPSEKWLMQQIGGRVILFNPDTEDEIVEFDPADAHACAKAQATISASALTNEDKIFAHFWSGYFFAQASGTATGPSTMPRLPCACGQPIEAHSDPDGRCFHELWT